MALKKFRVNLENLRCLSLNRTVTNFSKNRCRLLKSTERCKCSVHTPNVFSVRLKARSRPCSEHAIGLYCAERGTHKVASCK
jgi:hypothetical protein